MANELFKFTITDYTTNPLGVSTIIEEPIGWDGVEFELVRLETHGFVNRINIDGITFEFYGTAKNILDAAYSNYGVDAKVELKIEGRGNPNDLFQVVYNGLFKFNTYEQVCGIECYTKCGIVQDGCYYLFANRKDKSVDLSSVISFDGDVLSGYSNLNRPITIPPKALLQTNKTETNSYLFNYPTTAFKGQSFQGVYWVGDNIFLTIPEINIANDEIKDQIHISQLANGDNTVNIGGFSTGSIQYLTNQGDFTQQLQLESDKKLRCSNNFTLTMDIDLDITISSPPTELFFYPSVRFQVFLYNPSIPVGGSIPIFDGTSYNGGSYFFPSNTFTQNITESFTANFDIPDGFFLYYGIIYTNVWRYNNPQNFDISVDVTKYDYELKNESECQETEAKVSLVNETLSRVVESYTNDCIRVKSDYFGRTDSDPYISANDGCGALEVLSSGLQVRGAYDEANSEFSLKTSYNDLFEGLDKIHGIGYGLEPDLVRGAGYKWLRIEPFKYFYQDDVILECDYPTKVSKKVNAEQIYSKILVGYNKWESIEAGGLQDLFAEREYQTNLTRANNMLDFRSNLIASDFALEVTRRLYGISKIDWQYDNDLFIICVKRGALIYEVETGADIINSATYIYSPQTLKNTRLTPIRNLLRQVPKLVQFIKPSLSYLLTFLNGKANYLASIQANSDPCILEDITGLLAENASIDINTYDDATNGEPKYVSEIISFEYPMNCANWASILANPYGKIGFKCPNELTYTYGFIDSIKFKPTKNIAEIKLKKEYA